MCVIFYTLVSDHKFHHNVRMSVHKQKCSMEIRSELVTGGERGKAESEGECMEAEEE